jgi:hypothetical protein
MIAQIVRHNEPETAVIGKPADRGYLAVGRQKKNDISNCRKEKYPFSPNNLTNPGFIIYS